MKTISAIESFTGGLLASTIVNNTGASKYFKGSIVAYDNKIKAKLGLNIEKGVMNKETALALASTAKKFFNTDIGIGFTGNAGPKALEGLIAGQVFIAINDKVYEKFFKGDRNEVRQAAVNFVLNKIKLGE